MFVSLRPGKYQLTCECGGTYQTMNLNRLHKKVSNTCYYCGKTGIYKRITMEDLAFGYNWNGKLNNNCFTTIRLHNAKYQPGIKFSITLENHPKGSATILEVKPFLLEKLNEFTARIDTGYPLNECKDMLRKMYKNNPLINWDTQQLDLILLQYDKVQTTLFNK